MRMMLDSWYSSSPKVERLEEKLRRLGKLYFLLENTIKQIHLWSPQATPPSSTFHFLPLPQVVGWSDTTQTIIELERVKKKIQQKMI